MPEVVISGDPHDIYRLFCFWRRGIDGNEAGAEELVAWQVAAGIFAEDKGAKGAKYPPSKAAAGKAAVETAAAKPPVGFKRRVPSILALLTARVSSEVASASSEVGPGGTEAAKTVALHGDGPSKGEINPEGLEVAETKRPQASRGEVAGDHSTPSPTMVGFDQRQREGHASLEFKAKNGGGLAIVAAKPKNGKGHTSDSSEIDPEEIKVAKNLTTEARIHSCAKDRERVREEQGGPEASDEVVDQPKDRPREVDEAKVEVVDPLVFGASLVWLATMIHG
jgi:hypothetical protein